MDKWRKAPWLAEIVVESYPQYQQKVQSFVDKCFFVLIFLQVVYNIYYILLVIFDAKRGQIFEASCGRLRDGESCEQKCVVEQDKKPLGTGKSQGANEIFT